MIIPWRSLGVIALAAAFFGGVWQIQDWRYEKKISDIAADHALASKAAEESARAEERRRQSVANEEGKKADERITDLESRASTAESQSIGLRGQIDRLRNGHAATCDTISTQQRKASASAVVVLGGLLEDSDRMAGDLAKALERSRIAGMSCEAIIDGIRNRTRP